jgi:hypothetical protein
VGTSLTGGEDSLVDPLFDIRLLVLSEEDQTGPGSTQSLVGGGSDHVTVLEGRSLFTGGNQTGDMGHVAQQVRTVGVGDLPEPGVVPVTGVGGSTTDDESGLVKTGIGLQLLVVDQTGLGVDSVREGLEVDGRSGDLLLGGVVTVSQVTTVRESETHDPVLRVDQGSERGKVGGGSRVRLNVDSPDLGVKVESLESTVTTQVLEDIDVLVSSVVTSSGKTLRVLVGEHGTIGLHNGQRGQVLDERKERASELAGLYKPSWRDATKLTSEAMSSKPENCLQVSSSTILATSGSASASEVYKYLLKSVGTATEEAILMD